MSYLRFNHVFFALMTTALLSAFVFSPRASDRARAHVGNLFKPVSWPAAQVAGWTRERLTRQPARDDGSPANPRSSDQLVRENMQLRVAYASMKGQLDKLMEREAERTLLGDVRDLCTRFTVWGADPSPRETLMLSGSSMDGLREGMPVLYPGGIVGRLGRVGLGEARVLLVTDPQSKITVNFARFIRKPDNSVDSQILSAEAKLLEGTGSGQMLIRDVQHKFVQELGLRVDDWVVLSDRDWPMSLNHYRIGSVYSIEESKNPGFAVIRVRPDQKLIALREVMVMNKQKG